MFIEQINDGDGDDDDDDTESGVDDTIGMSTAMRRSVSTRCRQE